MYRARSAGTASSFARSALLSSSRPTSGSRSGPPPRPNPSTRPRIRSLGAGPPGRTAPPARMPGNPPPPAAALLRTQAFVDVVRKDVEAALLVLIDVVVARARPVAVAVDQRDVERQELERAVDVQDRRERRFELSGGVWFRTFVKRDQIRPALRVVLARDLVEPLVVLDALAEVVQPGAAARAARHLPSRALRGVEEVAHEVLVELLRVHVDAPAFAVDHHAHEVDLRRRDVVARRSACRGPRGGRSDRRWR